MLIVYIVWRWCLLHSPFLFLQIIIQLFFILTNLFKQMPMKKLLFFGLFVALAFVNCISANAQSKAKVNVNGQVFSISVAGGG